MINICFNDGSYVQIDYASNPSAFHYHYQSDVVENVTSVHMDAADLMVFLSKAANIPYVGGLYYNRYFGDMAKFIVANL